MPSVSSNYMRIISPTILELVMITSDTSTWDFSSTLPDISEFEGPLTLSGTITHACKR